MRSAGPGSAYKAAHPALPLRLLGPFLFLIAAAGPACAQDDGARLYMMAPDKTTIASLRFHRLHSNLAVDPGSVAGDARLHTNLVVFQFVRALNFSGRQGWIFL